MSLHFDNTYAEENIYHQPEFINGHGNRLNTDCSDESCAEPNIYHRLEFMTGGSSQQSTSQRNRTTVTNDGPGIRITQQSDKIIIGQLKRELKKAKLFSLFVGSILIVLLSVAFILGATAVGKQAAMSTSSVTTEQVVLLQADLRMLKKELNNYTLQMKNDLLDTKVSLKDQVNSYTKQINDSLTVSLRTLEDQINNYSQRIDLALLDPIIDAKVNNITANEPGKLIPP